MFPVQASGPAMLPGATLDLVKVRMSPSLLLCLCCRNTPIGGKHACLTICLICLTKILSLRNRIVPVCLAMVCVCVCVGGWVRLSVCVFDDPTDENRARLFCVLQLCVCVCVCVCLCVCVCRFWCISHDLLTRVLKLEMQKNNVLQAVGTLW